MIDRRAFLTGTMGAAAAIASPAVLRAQGNPIRIGFPLPLTGPFDWIAADQQKGAQLAMDVVNARGGVLGRKIEVLFRDDELKPAVGAQRTKELIENQHVEFIVGGLAAHVQMAINEQAKAAGKIFISISQSDEISAKPDSGPLTFHEALNPTITGRAVGSWAVKNVGKKFWIVYADYAWGKQNNAVFTDVVGKAGGTVLGSTPYPLGKPEFSTHFPKILAAKPEVVLAAVPGNDAVAFMKQAISFGVKQQAQIVWPLHFLDLAKTVGIEAFADTYGGTSFYWELQDSIPEAKKYVDAFTKKFNRPPDSYSGYGYSGIMEVVRGVELAKSTNSDAVATALLNNPGYAHYKSKQWWRKCDRKGFQDLWIVKGRKQLKGEWGYFDTVAKVAADEALDRTCGEKGYA